jgi:hypothetical protein
MIRFLTAVLVVLSSIGGSAQNSSATVPKDCNDPSVMCITKDELKPLEPTPGGKFWRGFQYTYQLSEQPAFVAVSSAGTTQIIPNPEKYLNQHTLSYQFSELFPKVSNLAAMVAAVYAAQPGTGKSDKTLRLDSKLCGNRYQIECLVSGGNFWQRLLSSASVSYSESERDEVQQWVLLTSFPTSQHYGPAGEVDFDPASLFITGANWQNAVAALKDINVDEARFFGGDYAGCFDKGATTSTAYKTCLTQFARPRFAAGMGQGTGTKIAAVLIPKFQFKAISQFDFVKNGGVLVAEPGLQRSLKNYSFTWDLRRTIASTSDRIAALKAYKSYSVPPVGEVKQPRVCVTVTDGYQGYVPVGDKVTAEGCRKIAQDAGADEFALACASVGNVVLGARVKGAGSIQDRNLPPSNTCKW